MNKHDFMNQLYALLSPLNENERRDIMRDFEEHFAVGAEKGKSEEQICRELGTPRQCASQFLTPEQSARLSNAKKVNNTLYKVLAICLIISLIAAVPSALGCIAAAIVIMIVSCVSGVILSSWLIFGFLISLSVALLSFGVLIILVEIALIKLCWKKGGM